MRTRVHKGRRFGDTRVPTQRSAMPPARPVSSKITCSEKTGQEQTQTADSGQEETGRRHLVRDPEAEAGGKGQRAGLNLGSSSAQEPVAAETARAGH